MVQQTDRIQTEPGSERRTLIYCHGAPQVRRDKFVRGCVGVDVPH